MQRNGLLAGSPYRSRQKFAAAPGTDISPPQRVGCVATEEMVLPGQPQHTPAKPHRIFDLAAQSPLTPASVATAGMFIDSTCAPRSIASVCCYLPRMARIILSRIKQFAQLDFWHTPPLASLTEPPYVRATSRPQLHRYIAKRHSTAIHCCLPQSGFPSIFLFRF